MVELPPEPPEGWLPDPPPDGWLPDLADALAWLPDAEALEQMLTDPTTDSDR